MDSALLWSHPHTFTFIRLKILENKLLPFLTLSFIRHVFVLQIPWNSHQRTLNWKFVKSFLSTTRSTLERFTCAVKKAATTYCFMVILFIQYCQKRYYPHEDHLQERTDTGGCCCDIKTTWFCWYGTDNQGSEYFLQHRQCGGARLF